ncbi:hypothetical protein PUN28_008037 [Cardiocondyla obscurior]
MSANSEGCVCDYCSFITGVLIPEMVYDRYFCETGSREFVELDSVDAKHFERNNSRVNVVHRVTAHVKFSGVTNTFHLIVKQPRQLDDSLLPFSQSFLNEEIFYSKMTHDYGTDNIPKCYLSDLGRYGRPVIVLEDLAARGYMQAVDDKLDEDHLKLCIKVLATFHGKGLKLREYNFPIFREFYAKLYEPTDWLHFRTSPNADKVRIFESTLKNSALKDEANISEIIRKMEDVTTKLELNDFWTICHGNFTRSNLLFRYENGRPCDVKVIDWSTMRYCSPSIDFGHIFLQNLPGNENLSEIKQFSENMLRIYLEAIKDKYQEVNYKSLEREIISKLPFAYGMIENHMLGETKRMLHALDLLGSFD